MATKKTAGDNVTGRPATRTAKSDRPQKGSDRADGRPQRNARSIGEFRDILGVLNKDSDYRYRWVLSMLEFDKRIYDARRAGWDFVDASKEHDLIPGEYAVGKGNGVEGSFYRIPAGRRQKDEYLYLMRMPVAYAEEVDGWKDENISETESDLFRKRALGEDDGNEQHAGQYTIRQDVGYDVRHRPAR